MAQFRTTAELVSRILKRCGEPTNGNSSYTTDVVEYLTKVHNVVIAGGSIFDTEVDEAWNWAKSETPIVFNFETPYETGTVSLTEGSEAGTFSSAPSASLEGWFLKVGTDAEIYRIVSHTAGASAFELDTDYLGATASAGTFIAYKLDYTLEQRLLYVTAANNKIDFKEVGGTGAGTYAVTLTSGAYTPSELATEVKTQLDSVGDDTWTVSYSSQTKKFTLLSNLNGGGTSVELLGATGTSAANSALPLLGFDDLDYTGAATYSSNYPIAAISRLIEPFLLHGSAQENPHIVGLDPLTFMKDFPFTGIGEGTPTHFTKIKEDREGRITVRFNAYPAEAQKVEVGWIPAPRDLQNNSVSYPKVPRKFIDILEYGASYFLLLDKEDDKANLYAGLAKAQLQAMQKQNRTEQFRFGEDFARIVPRRDNTRKRLRYGYTEND